MKLFKILMFCLPLVLSANGIKQEKSKTIHKKFEVTSDATISVTNKYGNINVITWDKNTVEFDIKITVSGSNMDKINSKLNDISIIFENSRDNVSAKTQIQSSSSGWGWFGSNRSNISFKINYIVKIPKTNNLKLKNKYGNIELPVLFADTQILCSYGNLYAESLKAADIELNYSRNSEIKEVENAKMEANYSDIKIEEGSNLKMEADYSNVEIQTSNNLKIRGDYTKYNIGKNDNVKFNLDYGRISIENAKVIQGNSSYTKIHIGTVEEKVIIDTDYGNLKIERFLCKNTISKISSSYVGVEIFMPENNSLSFKVNTSYSKFIYPKEKTELYKSIKNISSSHFEGVIGNKNTKTQLIINADYGRGVLLGFDD